MVIDCAWRKDVKLNCIPVKIQIRIQIEQINPRRGDKPDKSGLNNIAKIDPWKMDSVGLVNEKAFPANIQGPTSRHEVLTECITDDDHIGCHDHLSKILRFHLAHLRHAECLQISLVFYIGHPLAKEGVGDDNERTGLQDIRILYACYTEHICHRGTMDYTLFGQDGHCTKASNMSKNHQTLSNPYRISQDSAV